MDAETANNILQKLLNLEIDEDVLLVDIINKDYIPDLLETIHVITNYFI